MPPKEEQSKRKQPAATRRPAKLAKKRRTIKPQEDRQALQQDVEEPEVKAEPMSEDEAPLAVTPRIKVEQGHDDDAEADYEAEDLQGGGDVDERLEFPESGPEEFDDPEYHEIRRKREIEVSPLLNLPHIPRLIKTLRGDGSNTSDQRLTAIPGTNRLRILLMNTEPAITCPSRSSSK
ncbi:hypothetical protein BOTNAR_0471g00060 [Botryotinia narcissicola]|uniref:Uncharacterized protein n=1 Tax=Botryotinia narcissicola TaxID=278944 RepID=A0A4Z1HHI8_9HELO|nr:hypothetical protein BOTNAR_0471g00060 [Botryotinia narcissicola]